MDMQHVCKYFPHAVEKLPLFFLFLRGSLETLVKSHTEHFDEILLRPPLTGTAKIYAVCKNSMLDQYLCRNISEMMHDMDRIIVEL